MKGFIRTLLPASLVVCALIGSVSASASAQAAHRGRPVVRHTAWGAKVLCADGTWDYANRGNCANHDGIAVRQPTYGTNTARPGPAPTPSPQPNPPGAPTPSLRRAHLPPAPARARAGANYHSAVVRSGYSSGVRAHAIAQCSDGTYWHSTKRRGACAANGGVQTWF